jgi:hypothetical protein
MGLMSSLNPGAKQRNVFGNLHLHLTVFLEPHQPNKQALFIATRLKPN